MVRKCGVDRPYNAQAGTKDVMEGQSWKLEGQTACQRGPNLITCTVKLFIRVERM